MAARGFITMTAYRRPAYTAQVLRSLAAADTARQWRLLVQVEPPDAATSDEDQAAAEQTWQLVQQLCEELDLSPWRVQRNPQRLGLNRNTHAVLSAARAAMDATDWLLHIEDDTLLAPDALHWYAWALAHYADDPRVFTIAGYHRCDEVPPATQWYHCRQRDWFTCWGWACWGYRLAELLERWSFTNPKSFAWHLNRGVRGNRREVHPLLSRVQNIGYLAGENDRSEQWYREHHRTPVWASALPAVPPVPFQEADHAPAC